MSFSSFARAPSFSTCVAPRGDGIVLVEPHAELDEVPQRVDVRVAEELGRPALVRHAGDDPVVEPLVRLARQLFAERPHPRLADAVAGQVGEELRLRVAHQRDDRRVLLAEVLRRARGATAASTRARRRPRARSSRGGRAGPSSRRRRTRRRPGTRPARPRARRGRARSARSPRRAARAGRSRRPGRSARRTARPGRLA